MKRAASPAMLPEEATMVVEGVVEGVEEVILPDEKRLKMEAEEEVCIDEGLVGFLGFCFCPVTYRI